MNYSDMKNYDYIYDKNGKTIGIQAKYTKSGNFDADTNIAEQNGMKLVHIDGNFWFVDSKYENEYSLLNINDIQTVENLNFSQIVSAFQSGDLTVSELEKWCTANGVNDLTVESNELRKIVKDIKEISLPSFALPHLRRQTQSLLYFFWASGKVRSRRPLIPK